MSAVEAIISPNSEADIGISLEKTTWLAGFHISDHHRGQFDGLVGKIFFSH